MTALKCQLWGHRPDRRRASHDGLDFWTNCRRCGAPMIRRAEGWSIPSSEEYGTHRTCMNERMRQFAKQM